MSDDLILALLLTGLYTAGLLVGRFLTPYWWTFPLYALAFFLGQVIL